MNHMINTSAHNNHMPALTGVRFFAIFHIFMFHLWTLYNLDLDAPYTNLLQGFDKLPGLLVRYCSNGWMSTSFFFLLSGFILSYLYWLPNGTLATSKKHFWVQRFTRIYPIHLIVLLPTMVIMVGQNIGSLTKALNFLSAFIASAALMQAWVPPWVPMLSWPTWTLSALVFLYLVAPWLMQKLGQYSIKKMWFLLALLPVISLVPTTVVTAIVQNPTKFDQNWSIFVGSTPLFWVPHFVAGMLLARVTGISRLNADWRPSAVRLVSWGDLALVAIVGICLLPNIGNEPFKYFMRHGLVMPLYAVIIVDLARGHAIAPRLFSFPGTGFLGQTGFSIFVWQNLIMVFCWISLMINPALSAYHLEAAVIGAIVIGVVSTYKIEQPLARRLRKRWLGE